MSELRKDTLTGRWVIIAPERANRPNAFQRHTITHDAQEDCPFCPGHEEMTPPDIYTMRSPTPEKPDAGWNVRVIPNRYPALRIEGMTEGHSEGLYDKMMGVGAHEITIETPVHDADPADLTVKQVADTFTAHCQRMNDLFRDKRFQYILIFKNHGAGAGATLSHAHSQLIALPILPVRIEQELKGASKYFRFRGRCYFCDVLSQEKTDRRRTVSQNGDFIAYAPFTSRFPFEIHIMPQRHEPFFWQMQRKQVEALAEVLRDVLRRYKLALKNPPFSYIIHTAPPEYGHPKRYHWHMELVPKLAAYGGFEWGSGFYINPTPPEEAARYLRELDKRMDVPKNYLLTSTGTVTNDY